MIHSQPLRTRASVTRVAASLWLLTLLCSAASAMDPTVGLCTRKDEFLARLEKLDPVIAQLSAQDNAKKRASMARQVAKKHGVNSIECLIRYREPALADVFVQLLGNKRWPIRGRALYGLKMVGDQTHVSAVTPLLVDKEAQVRELAASTLGHLGGDEAKAALTARLDSEKDAQVRATLEAAIALAASDERPYARLSSKTEPWQETLVGPPGARRVDYAWVVKGQSSFNDYDARTLEVPVAESFGFPILWYEGSLFGGYPRNSFGGKKGHAAEDCAWFREGCSYYAIADGVVRMLQGAGGDWGFLIVIEHELSSGDHVTAVYGHAAWDVLVKPGDLVVKGQKIATQGLSTSIENGGYGAHLHFGLGDGPFRRPSKHAKGESISIDTPGGKVAGKLLRFGYSATERNQYRFPRLTAVVMQDDGTTTECLLPDEEPAAEVSWLQAYIPECKGWLDPQEWLPANVERK